MQEIFVLALDYIRWSLGATFYPKTEWVLSALITVISSVPLHAWTQPQKSQDRRLQANYWVLCTPLCRIPEMFGLALPLKCYCFLCLG